MNILNASESEILQALKRTELFVREFRKRKISVASNSREVYCVSQSDASFKKIRALAAIYDVLILSVENRNNFEKQIVFDLVPPSGHAAATLMKQITTLPHVITSCTPFTFSIGLRDFFKQNLGESISFAELKQVQTQCNSICAKIKQVGYPRLKYDFFPSRKCIVFGCPV